MRSRVLSVYEKGMPMSALTILLVAVIILVVIIIVMYNNLVKLRNSVDNAWSQVEVQLQRRLDLIPNLVETVKGYAEHESSTLQAVTDARSAYMSARTPEEKMAADNALTQTLKSLFAVSEGYPNLMASQNFIQLQNELSETEDKISYMRQSFNDTVMKYNNAIQTFPGNVFAGPFGFTRRNSYVSDLGAESAPVVDFGSETSRAD